MINQTHGNILQNDQMATNKPFRHIQTRKPRRVGFGSDKYMLKMANLLEKAEELFLNTHSCYSNKLNLVRTINERNLIIIDKLKENIQDLHNTWDMDIVRREKLSGLRKNLTKDKRLKEKENSHAESCSQLDDVMDTPMMPLVQGNSTTLGSKTSTLEKSKSSMPALTELNELVSKIRNRYCNSDLSTHSSSLQTLRDEDYYEKKIDELFPRCDVTNEGHLNDLSNKVTPNDVTSAIRQDVMLNEVTGLLEPVTDLKNTSSEKEGIFKTNEFRTVVVSTPINYTKANDILFGFGQTSSGLILNYVFDASQQKWIISH